MCACAYVSRLECEPGERSVVEFISTPLAALSDAPWPVRRPSVSFLQRGEWKCVDAEGPDAHWHAAEWSTLRGPADTTEWFVQAFFSPSTLCSILFVASLHHHLQGDRSVLRLRPAATSGARVLSEPVAPYCWSGSVDKMGNLSRISFFDSSPVPKYNWAALLDQKKVPKNKKLNLGLTYLVHSIDIWVLHYIFWVYKCKTVQECIFLLQEKIIISPWWASHRWCSRNVAISTF